MSTPMHQHPAGFVNPKPASVEDHELSIEQTTTQSGLQPFTALAEPNGAFNVKTGSTNGK